MFTDAENCCIVNLVYEIVHHKERDFKSQRSAERGFCGFFYAHGHSKELCQQRPVQMKREDYEMWCRYREGESYV